MENESYNKGQINQYDKILKENIEAALPGLIKNVLHINIVHSEELPDSIQHTKEREPDMLKKVTDDQGNTFVLQIEFQTTNDGEMAYRMADYMVMLLWKYRLPVKQYVFYIGEGAVTTPTEINVENLHFKYPVIAVSSIDYNLFLRSGNPEEKIFAILGDFGKDSPEKALTKIFADVAQSAKSGLEGERRKNQLRVLINLLKFAISYFEIMESIASFFKEEDDILYQIGEKRGFEKGVETGRERNSRRTVKNLLTGTNLSVETIAEMAEVSVDFVLKIKASL